MKGIKNQNVVGVPELLFSYGRHTPWFNIRTVRSYEAAMPQKSTLGNHWSSTENSSNNAWNVNFNSGNTWNNNKYNTNVVRPSVAHETAAWIKLRKSVQYAYEECCRGKSSSIQAQEYIPHANEDLDVLTDELISRTYYPTTSTCFLVKYPKWREVFAAAFRDRVVHHWVCLRLEPLFEMRNERLNNVTHNCRKGFGTKTAVSSAASGIRRVTNNYSSEGWIFKGDLVGFFMTIVKRRMCDKLLSFTRRHYHKSDKDLLLWLIEIIVMHHPEKDCVFNSRPEDWANLTANKSLFRCEEGRGSPIGNLTTQLFANFFMSEFDCWIQNRLKELADRHGIRWSYTRFVDDFIVVCSDKKILLRLIDRIAEKLGDMGLLLHKDKRYIQPASHGVMFVGTYIKNGRLYLSNRTLARFQEKVHGFNLYLQRPEKEITLAELEHIRATVNSYLGFCRGRQTFKRRREILWDFCHNHQKYFSHDRNWTKIKLKKKYKPIYN